MLASRVVRTEAVPQNAPRGVARIAALDTLRGVAVLGILILNIVEFGLPVSYEMPLAGGATGIDLWTWRVTTILFEGTMRGLFSLLFGASMMLLLERVAAREGDRAARTVHYRRMAWLVLFGVVHWLLLLWPGDVLFWYGIIGALVFSLRRLPVAALIGVGIAAYLLGTAGAAFGHFEARSEYAAAVAVEPVPPDERTAAMRAASAAWAERVEAHRQSPDEIAAIVARRLQTSYPAMVVAEAPEAFDWQVLSFPIYGLLDIAPMMLIGIALYRAGVLTGARPSRFYSRLAIGGYALGLGINLWEVWTLERGDFALLPYLQTLVSYEFGRLAMTMGHLGLILWLLGRGAAPGLRTRLAAVGRMAFSNYVLTTILCNALFTGIGFGLFGQLARHQLYYVVAGVWAVQLLWSPVWLARYRFGPLEWLWRALTYGRAPPLRLGTA